MGRKLFDTSLAYLKYPEKSEHFEYLPPPMSIPPQGTTVPPHPGGNRHQVTVLPLGGGEPYTTPDQPILV